MYADGSGNAIELGGNIDYGYPGIGEELQWFYTAHYNGPPGRSYLYFYNDWDFTSPDPTYCPTCVPNGTTMFSYLSGDGLSSFYYWYYTQPTIEPGYQSGYMHYYPDVLLGTTADEATLGPPALAFSSDCTGNSQFGRGIGFYPTPVPNNDPNPSLPGEFFDGTFQPSSPGFLISSVRAARNQYGFLDPVSNSPNTWQTLLYYNNAVELNGTACPAPTMQSVFRNSGGSGSPVMSWAASQVTITEQ